MSQLPPNFFPIFIVIFKYLGLNSNPLWKKITTFMTQLKFEVYFKKKIIQAAQNQDNDF